MFLTTFKCPLPARVLSFSHYKKQLSKKGARVKGIAEANGNMVMVTGASFSWVFLGVEWINEHSGFFLAVGAIISTVVTVWGALRANSERVKTLKNDK